MAAVSNGLSLHQGFATMTEACDIVEKELKEKYNPMHRETKETVRNFNKKCRKVERQITELSEDDQYSQR